MSKAKKCCKLKRSLIVICVLAVLAFIGWLVYYLFFADDPEELDESLFAEKKEAGPEDPAEEAVADAEAAEDTEEEAQAEEPAAPEAEPKA